VRAQVASKNNKLIRLRRIPVFLPSSLLAGIQRRAFMNGFDEGTETEVKHLIQRTFGYPRTQGENHLLLLQ